MGVVASVLRCVPSLGRGLDSSVFFCCSSRCSGSCLLSCRRWTGLSLTSGIGHVSNHRLETCYELESGRELPLCPHSHGRGISLKAQFSCSPDSSFAARAMGSAQAMGSNMIIGAGAGVAPAFTQI